MKVRSSNWEFLHHSFIYSLIHISTLSISSSSYPNHFVGEHKLCILGALNLIRPQNWTSSAPIGALNFESKTSCTFGNYDSQTNRPTDQLTNQRTDRQDRKLIRWPQGLSHSWPDWLDSAKQGTVRLNFWVFFLQWILTLGHSVRLTMLADCGISTRKWQ